MKIRAYDSSFGKVSIATQDSKLVGVFFGAPNNIIDHHKKYHNCVVDDGEPCSDIVNQVLNVIDSGIEEKINHHLFGSSFQVKVWKELVKIQRTNL